MSDSTDTNSGTSTEAPKTFTEAEVKARIDSAVENAAKDRVARAAASHKEAVDKLTAEFKTKEDGFMSEASKLRMEATKLRLAYDSGVDKDVIELLKGDTEEELLKSIETVKAKFGSKEEVKKEEKDTPKDEKKLGVTFESKEFKDDTKSDFASKLKAMME